MEQLIITEDTNRDEIVEYAQRLFRELDHKQNLVDLLDKRVSFFDKKEKEAQEKLITARGLVHDLIESGVITDESAIDQLVEALDIQIEAEFEVTLSISVVAAVRAPRNTDFDGGVDFSIEAMNFQSQYDLDISYEHIDVENWERL